MKPVAFREPPAVSEPLIDPEVGDGNLLTVQRTTLNAHGQLGANETFLSSLGLPISHPRVRAWLAQSGESHTGVMVLLAREGYTNAASFEQLRRELLQGEAGETLAPAAKRKLDAAAVKAAAAELERSEAEGELDSVKSRWNNLLDQFQAARKSQDRLGELIANETRFLSDPENSVESAILAGDDYRAAVAATNLPLCRLRLAELETLRPVFSASTKSAEAALLDFGMKHDVPQRIIKTI